MPTWCWWWCLRTRSPKRCARWRRCARRTPAWRGRPRASNPAAGASCMRWPARCWAATCRWRWSPGRRSPRKWPQGLPTALTVHSDDAAFCRQVADALHGPAFRAYTGNDMLGAELGGAMKNVLAVATGVADGMGLGLNARAGLITRGLNEMLRLNLALGGRPETLMGLAGLGDLVLTCTGDLSRNRRLGLALGRGAVDRRRGARDRPGGRIAADRRRGDAAGRRARHRTADRRRRARRAARRRSRRPKAWRG